MLAAGLAAGGVAPGGLATGQDDVQRGGGGRGPSGTAKNVVLVVGDGLSIAARDAIRLSTVGKDGLLAMDQLRYAGWTATDSADPDDAVTDSAAAATAFATGVRTYNGAVAVDVDGNPVRTLLEHAKALRKATGLVTTAQVTDATPAAFGAHVPDRGTQTEIARQLVEVSRPDVILGGGEDWWYPTGDEGAYPDDPADPRPEVSRSTIGNLVERAQEVGYTYVSTAAELEAADADRLLGLFANEEMFEQAPEGQGDEYAPVVPLATMTAKALDVLSQDRHGFFLLVEEEGVDEMAHANNGALTLAAGQALDETVAVVRDFAQRHRNTLVVVVGDHETGGLAVENVDPEDESGDPASTDPGVLQSLEDGPFPVAGSDLQFTIDWTTSGHTGAATPLTAEGPGAERLARSQRNTDVFDVVLDAMHGRR
ncbi:alkaline phosphatase [Cellulomonas fimi]|uniref:Alkaline phosphatase n=1 Tax=Cellulomonas fimi (strain ATCC 484 / DSM 20113 / JCM 1341 / CCUG 24087 / LMG 16345 / NBRC 15513 / NCIMB 8980 / NCTC 7547 / NRS-133) TaxID=590998 RepID=F4H568_CELFA|nr:alkaline phosphatase [Cellulomonas fimi]AEE46674.1 Alkaline phosphatase [Cellulomonas fimi ATCC 484]VEH33845.1 Alkaline phosphatase 4 precursor [Cellulomonas fimi]